MNRLVLELRLTLRDRYKHSDHLEKKKIIPEDYDNSVNNLEKCPIMIMLVDISSSGSNIINK